MSDSRLGCYYCFGTLDPQDKQEELRTFVKCNHCGTIYHTVCWRQCENCPRCGEGQSEPVDVSRPASLRTVAKTGSLPIEASAVVYSIGAAGIVVPDSIHKNIPPAFRGYEILIPIIPIGILLLLCCWCLIIRLILSLGT